MSRETKAFLDPLVEQFEAESWIDDDPISIPHAFDDPRDQETIGLFAALLAWGQRPVILSKLAELCERMGNRPFDFVRNFSESRDAHKLVGFKHRTFNDGDAIILVRNLGRALRTSGSIEALFQVGGEDADIGPGIESFASAILDAHSDTPRRLGKHVARPSTGSACKRLAMYVRWMVRSGPVDLGIWDSIRPDQLVAPLDVHSGRQARALGLLTRKADDWRSALELTRACRGMCATDPVRYDFALFGIGVHGIDIPPHLQSSQIS